MMRSDLLGIKDVSKKLGVPKPTLRYWEKRFQGILSPIRTDGGQRRYSVEQLAVIEQIKSMKNEGKRLSEIEEKLRHCVISGLNEPCALPIDALTDRIARVVRAEIFNFLKSIESAPDNNEPSES